MRRREDVGIEWGRAYEVVGRKRPRERRTRAVGRALWKPIFSFLGGGGVHWARGCSTDQGR